MLGLGLAPLSTVVSRRTEISSALTVSKHVKSGQPVEITFMHLPLAQLPWHGRDGSARVSGGQTQVSGQAMPLLMLGPIASRALGGWPLLVGSAALWPWLEALFTLAQREEIALSRAPG